MNKKVVFLPYDMDTAIGINNEGALVFSYNLEDTDQVGGADVFNGQESVLWCNLRDMFGTELKEMYQQLRSSGALSYEKVERAFEEHQAKWPEAVFNEDAFFKYIQPLMDDGDESYLSMLQGSKAEQRKWWLYNRFKYMDSKFNCGDALTDYIQLRGYAKSSITATPYADIYIGIKWGSMLRQQRGTKNQQYVMACPLDNVNDTEIYIYSASQLSSVGDLSGLKVGFADFHNATKLLDLILGSTANGYTNPNLRSINVGNLKLLRKIDARNCTGLGTYADQKSVDLSGCSGIEEVYFDGTNILGVELPNGGFLKKLHLPGTITNLTVRNQTHVSEFVCPDLSHVSTLYMEANGNSFDVSNIVDHVAAGCRIRIFNYRWDFASIAAVHTFLDKFEGMTGMDQNGDNTAEPQIFATVHVPSATGDEIDSVTARYPDITVDADVASYYVRYYNWEGDTLLYTETVQKGQNGTYASQPSHASTAQYNFVFAGWNSRKNSTTNEASCRSNVQSNVNVYAAYTTTVRTYTVTFQNSNGTVLQTVNNVPYGGTATYTGVTPTHPTDPTNMAFQGFSPTGVNITGNTTCVATYQDVNSPFIKYLKRNLTAYTSNTIATIGEYTFYNMTTLASAEFTATTISQYAFSGCANLETVDMKATSGVISIAGYAFFNCNKLKSLFIRSNSVATLTSTNALPSGPFTRGDAAIYVPSELVSNYKSASNWSTYKSRIFPISAYPVTDFSTISMTWSQLKAAIDDETFFSAGYAVGDIKQFTYGQHTVYAEIRKIDTTNKHVDFVIKNFDETVQMNSSSMMTKYSDSLAKARLDTIYSDELPSDLKAAISSIVKKYYAYDGTTEEITVPLWLLNTKDAGLTGINLKDSEGENYFSSNTERIKNEQATASASTWWLGSVRSSSFFTVIINSGSGNNGNPGSTCGLVFGFRIKKSS